MARTLPALPFTLPEPTVVAPRNPIKAPDLQHTALGQASNLAFSTVHATNLLHQWWPDGQWTRDVAAFETQGTIRIPYLSGLHTDVQCLVYGKSDDEDGEVRFSSDNAGDSTTVSLAATTQWYGTDGSGTAHLDVTGGFGPHAGDRYEDVLVEGNGDLTVSGICLRYLDLAPNGDWPGDDDELPAGPVSDLTTGLVWLPTDDLEVAADAPLASDYMKRLGTNLTIVDSRVRVIYAFMGLANPSNGNGWMTQYPHRVPVVVRPGGTTLTVWIQAEGSAADGEVWIQAGRGGRQAIADRSEGGTIHRITGFGTTGPVWKKTTIKLRATNDFNAPRGYAGVTHLAVLPGPAGANIGDTRVHSVTIWAR